MTKSGSDASQGSKNGSRESSSGGTSLGEGVEEREKETRMYTFTPVDRYGDSKDETEPLEDLGTITFHDNINFYTCIYIYIKSVLN